MHRVDSKEESTRCKSELTGSEDGTTDGWLLRSRDRHHGVDTRCRLRRAGSNLRDFALQVRETTLRREAPADQ